MSSERVPLLLFSGGLDSTAILQQSLEVSDVDVLYVIGRQCPTKAIKEQKTVSKIINYFNKLSNKFKVRNTYIIDLKNLRIVAEAHKNGVVTKYIQAIDWIFAALDVINPNLHSALYMGYCQQDGFVELQNLIDAWTNLLKIRVYGTDSYNVTNYIGEVPLQCPFFNVPKLTRLMWLNPPLRKMIWVCETPKKYGAGYRACGKCKPCKDHPL